jgi:hypothetical protein
MKVNQFIDPFRVVFSALILVLTGLAACTTSPKTLTDTEYAFARCYADMMVLEAEFETLPDSLKNNNFNKTDSLRKVFALYNTSKDQFIDELKRYQQDEKKWQLILRTSLEMLEEKRKEL